MRRALDVGVAHAPGNLNRAGRRAARRLPPWVDCPSTFFVTVCAAARGQAVLTNPGVAHVLADSIWFRDRNGMWETGAYVIMPDHAHLLVSVSDARRLSCLVSGWKRHTARTCGVRWQRSFFDRRLRRHESLRSTIDYIRENPVRAGLVERPEDWPHLWVR